MPIISVRRYSLVSYRHNNNNIEAVKLGSLRALDDTLNINHGGASDKPCQYLTYQRYSFFFIHVTLFNWAVTSFNYILVVDIK